MQSSQITGIAFSLVSVLLIQHFGRALLRGRSSHGWRRTDGYLVGRGAPSGSLQRLDAASAVPTYTYSVNGVEYTSNRYDIARSKAVAGGADAFADHAVGQRVTVWYDPAEPSRAVLVPGIQNTTWQRLLAGVALLVVGVSFLIAGTVAPGSAKPSRQASATASHT